MFWDEMWEPDQTRGVQAKLVSRQNSHILPKNINQSQKLKKRKAQNHKII
jgi:hypothetical protein